MMKLFKRKSRVERISIVLDRNEAVYADYWHSEKGEKKWLKDLDKVFKDMKKNGTPEELKEFLAYRYPFHCWGYGLKDMEETIFQAKHMNIFLPEVKKIPERIGELINLEVLELDNHTYDYLPSTISNLTNLKTLSIIVEQHLLEIIFGIQNLEELILTKSKINFIPKSVQNLKKIKILELSYTDLDALPETITHMSTLTQLGLMNNEITHILDPIGNLINLERLNLMSNPIKFISPNIVYCKYLKQLFIKNTRLDINHQNDLQKLLPNTEIFF